MESATDKPPKTHDQAAEAVAELGGEPLDGSGFEHEAPEPDFAAPAEAALEPLDAKAEAILADWRNAPNFRPFVHMKQR